MDDRQWIVRAMAGDRDAKTQLFDQTVRGVYYLCWRLTGSAAQAGELTRRTYARAFSGLPSLRPELSFERWTTAITVNLCRQSLKKTNPQLFAVHPAEDELFRADEVDEACLPPDCVSDPQLRVRALRTVSLLPPEQRVSMVLRYAALLKPHQIAKLMDVDEFVVYCRLNSGRRALRDALPCPAPAAMITTLFAAESAALPIPAPVRSSCLQTALSAMPEDEPPVPVPDRAPAGSESRRHISKKQKHVIFGSAGATVLLLVLVLCISLLTGGRNDVLPEQLTVQQLSAGEPAQAEKISSIRTWYSDFQDASAEYEQSSWPNHTSYARDGRVDCIRFDSEATGEGRYSVCFYYKDGEPYFIYLYGLDGDERELRLYYWNGILIRWIEGDGEIHETPNEVYQKMYDWAVEQYDAAHSLDA